MRLSSITSFPSMSQPESVSQTALHRVASSTPAEQLGNFPLLRAESFPLQSHHNSFPPNALLQSTAELNPYHYFASSQPSALPQAEAPSQSAPLWGSRATNLNTTLPCWDFRQNISSTAPYSVPDPPPVTHSKRIANNLDIEPPNADAIPTVADFRSLLPQARSLPFAPIKRETKRKTADSNAQPKSSVKRKPVDGPDQGAAIDENARVNPPKKTKSATPTAVSSAAEAGVKMAQLCDSKPTGDSIGSGKGAQITAQQPKTRPRGRPRSEKRAQAPKRQLSTRPRGRPRKDSSNTIANAIPQVPSPKQTTSPEASKPAADKEPAKKSPKQSTDKKQPPKSVPNKIQMSPPSKSKSKLSNSTEKSKTSRASPVGEAGSIKDSRPNNSLRPYTETPVPLTTIKNYQSNGQKLLQAANACSKSASDSPSSVEAESNSTLVMTESEMLDALNQVTWKIIDQYEADLNEGYNRFEIAQYYVDHLHNTRAEFWYDKLAELGSVTALHVRQPVS